MGRASPALNWIASVRPSTGWPSLNTIIPTAPAAMALLTFATKVHVPRWTSVIRPAVAAGKSDISQSPLDVFASATGGMMMSVVGTTSAVTSPPPEFTMATCSSRRRCHGRGVATG